MAVITCSACGTQFFSGGHHVCAARNYQTVAPVSEDQLRAWLNELEHLRKQRDELQKSNTRLELENRDLRAIVRRIDGAYPFVEVSEELKEDEWRRLKLWQTTRGAQ